MAEPTTSGPTTATFTSTRKPRVQSRKQALIDALSKRKAPTVAALAQSLSLQPHSVRAAISGLRKAGHAVETVKSPTGGAATYRIEQQSTGAAPCAPNKADA
ncbi:DUF3489 domain-containing protein [Loktanella sp. 5RATIMAR09]|uniref:DUF3489 domain-containing protein n=1 Tax=Loktanella sp. 5RATIMAR09 TaxID=1225655 RepID=UPI000A865B0D|nr:DUF3489 domain-containing protein [Loktanella sp. 5RATIMAR09]